MTLKLKCTRSSPGIYQLSDATGTVQFTITKGGWGWNLYRGATMRDGDAYATLVRAKEIAALEYFSARHHAGTI